MWEKTYVAYYFSIIMIINAYSRCSLRKIIIDRYDYIHIVNDIIIIVLLKYCAFFFILLYLLPEIDRLLPFIRLSALCNFLLVAMHIISSIWDKSVLFFDTLASGKDIRCWRYDIITNRPRLTQMRIDLYYIILLTSLWYGHKSFRPLHQKRRLQTSKYVMYFHPSNC